MLTFLLFVAYVSQPQAPIQPIINESPLVETKVEDGKLLYERRWFHRGQSIYVEGRDSPRFAGTISAINNEMVCIYVMDSVFSRLFVRLVPISLPT